jgi:hypothetical protein
MATPVQYMSPLFEQLDILNTVYNNSIKPNAVSTDIPHNRIKTKLFPHQNALVHTMLAHRKRMLQGYVWKNQIISGKLGVLGDGPGLGKTLAVLAYIALLNKEVLPTNELVHNSTRYFYSHSIDTRIRDISHCNLIIVPPTHFWQWQEEITKHTTLQPYYVETRRALNKPNTAELMIASDFILATSKTYKHVAEFAETLGIRWNNVFIDEASTIYISGSDHPLNFQFLWLISSTWLPFLFKTQLYAASNFIHIKDRLSDINTELLTWLNNVKDDSIQYQMGLAASSFFKSYLPYNHNARSQIVLRNSLETLNTAIATAGVCSIQNIKCLSFLHSSLILNGGLLASYMKKVTIPQLYYSLNIPPTSINELVASNVEKANQIINKSADDCSICLDNPVNRTMLNCCNSSFCGECIMRHLQTKKICPNCRAPIDVNTLNWIVDGSNVDISCTSYKTRFETCIDILKGDINSKAIIYIIYDNIYYQLASKLDEAGIKADKLDLNVYNIDRKIKQFREGTTRVLCISNPDNIRGFSLQDATHIIFFHALPFYELRELLIHSAQRIHRKTPLTLVHLESEFDL